MNIHIFHDRAIEPRTLSRRLPLFCRVTTNKLKLPPRWDGKYINRQWLEAHIAANAPEDTDAILYVLEDGWQSTKGNLLGFHYGRTFFHKRVMAVKYRPGWADTAEHELLHAANALTRAYTGSDLSDVMGVDDFDTCVVHGDDPRFTEYEYVDVWRRITPALQRAINKKHENRGLYRQLVRIREILIAIEKGMGELHGLQHPVPGFPISQPYGVKNRRYPATLHHIGTDYATPVGTPVLAPWDGEIVSAGFDHTLGNHGVYRFTYRGKQYEARFLHLRENPGSGSRKRGEVIGYTGNSGSSTGPHLHVDIFRESVDLRGINARNFRKRTINPETFFA